MSFVALPATAAAPKESFTGSYLPYNYNPPAYLIMSGDEGLNSLPKGYTNGYFLSGLYKTNTKQRPLNRYGARTFPSNSPASSIRPLGTLRWPGTAGGAWAIPFKGPGVYTLRLSAAPLGQVNFEGWPPNVSGTATEGEFMNIVGGYPSLFSSNSPQFSLQVGLTDFDYEAAGRVSIGSVFSAGGLMGPSEYSRIRNSTDIYFPTTSEWASGFVGAPNDGNVKVGLFSSAGFSKGSLPGMTNKRMTVHHPHLGWTGVDTGDSSGFSTYTATVRNLSTRNSANGRALARPVTTRTLLDSSTETNYLTGGNLRGLAYSSPTIEMVFTIEENFQNVDSFKYFLIRDWFRTTGFFHINGASLDFVSSRTSLTGQVVSSSSYISGYKGPVSVEFSVSD